MSSAAFEFPVRRGLLLGLALSLTFWLLPIGSADAHHVLGRPSYSLGEDSNTPSSLEAEIRIGDFDVTYMVFPAFPQPDSQGRINLYVTSRAADVLFEGEVAFTVRDDSWGARLGFGGEEERIGVQRLDDGVYRQSFRFHEAGDYIVSAVFEADGAPYVIDFPLRVGPPSSVGPIGISLALFVAAILLVSLIQRRRAMTGKIRGAREEQPQ